MSFFGHFIFLQEGKPPLWFAALDGRSDIALLLLQYHAEVDLPCAVRYSIIISLEDVLPLKFMLMICILLLEWQYTGPLMYRIRKQFAIHVDRIT